MQAISNFALVDFRGQKIVYINDTGKWKICRYWIVGYVIVYVFLFMNEFLCYTVGGAPDVGLAQKYMSIRRVDIDNLQDE